MARIMALRIVRSLRIGDEGDFEELARSDQTGMKARMTGLKRVAAKALM